jgi:hypothetical protein
VERFVKGDDAWYEGVRRLEAAIASEEP